MQIFLITFLLNVSLSFGVLVKIKDLCDIEGLRENQLIGYGLVVGLKGTGDSKKSYVTVASVANMLRHFGITVDPKDVVVKNTAACVVTANLLPLFKKGDQIDVEVSSIGDAKDLKGGMLLMTPLLGPDNKVYAVAQGKIEGEGLVCKIKKGAIIEREIGFEFIKDNIFKFLLKEPDFTSAYRVASVINKRYPNSAKVKDKKTIEITVPKNKDIYEFLSEVENLEIEPVLKAKVVINKKTGTIILGSDVKVSRVAISHKDITLKVGEKQENVFILEEAVSVDDIVGGLNAVGAKPQDIIEILEILKEAGALHAELVFVE